jgi:hypothetical protein
MMAHETVEDRGNGVMERRYPFLHDAHVCREFRFTILWPVAQINSRSIRGGLMVLPLKCLVRGRRLFTVYLWGKPLAPSEGEGNSGRGQNSPIDKP